MTDTPRWTAETASRLTPDQLHEKVIRLLGGVNPSLRGEIANAVDALRAHALRQTTWQPIAIAPKDGTPVLTYDEGAMCLRNTTVGFTRSRSRTTDRLTPDRFGERYFRTQASGDTGEASLAWAQAAENVVELIKLRADLRAAEQQRDSETLRAAAFFRGREMLTASLAEAEQQFEHAVERYEAAESKAIAAEQRAHQTSLQVEHANGLIDASEARCAALRQDRDRLQLENAELLSQIADKLGGAR